MSIEQPSLFDQTPEEPQVPLEITLEDAARIGAVGDRRNRDTGYDPNRVSEHPWANVAPATEVYETETVESASTDEQTRSIPADARLELDAFRAGIEERRARGESPPKEDVAKDDGAFMATGLYIARRGGPFRSRGN